MTGPSTSSTVVPPAPPDAPPTAPPTPPTELTGRQLPPPPPASDRPDRRGRRRLLTGLAAALAACGLVAGTVAVVEAVDDDDSGLTADPPAASNDVASADGDGGGIATQFASLHDLVTTARPSIVAIHTTLTQTDMFGRQMQGEAAGTGWVLSADGFVATNAHVVDGSDSISVTLSDGTSAEAELIAADPRADLAVLKIDRDDLTPLPIGDSEALRVGDPVVAIGNALDLGAEPTVTDGIVSAKDRTIVEPNGQTLVDLIQTSAAINPGNSGGPLLDLEGRVVGINTAVSGQGQNIGFAISIGAANRLIEQLREGEVPQHALLGVTTRQVPTTDSGAAVPDDNSEPSTVVTTGAEIVEIAPGSAAEGSGLRVGDVILDVDGEPIAGPRDLAAAIASRLPGDEIEITVGRDRGTETVTVALGAHDETDS